ncbi:hypothetical protein H6G33_09730 [Calothrix sp. FACHB-1219]|uniref:hypothetical protein n=1 Tax=unclassified Calothrix TaxID=2619626 RepID=UPI00168920A2|nr:MULTISPECIES: hypothetical protein [unclassified Calothrix]MBD2201626.1 hypothetical protein [Calothrix sp. FACHB-168]MBD2217312.1 hypothetical protein [Calothrix sp. FACHB-1219]
MTILTEYNLSFEEKQRFDGNMLGDSSIVYKSKETNAPRYLHYSKHKEYLIWLSTKVNYFTNRPIWNKFVFDKRTRKTYYSYYIGTKSSLFFKNQRSRWYIGSKKILPNDLIIDKHLLLHWYLDDGSKATKGGIYFATDGFSFEEAEALSNKIAKYTNLNTSLHTNQGNPRVYIFKKNTKEFFDIIGKCPISSFEYKW